MNPVTSHIVENNRVVKLTIPLSGVYYFGVTVNKFSKFKATLFDSTGKVIATQEMSGTGNFNTLHGVNRTTTNCYMLLSGDLDNITGISLGGNDPTNTTTYELSKLRNLESLQVNQGAGISGDVKFLPRTLKSINSYWAGASSLTGFWKDLPPNLEVFIANGAGGNGFCYLTGTVADLPRTLKTFDLQNNVTNSTISLTGNISDLPPNITYFVSNVNNAKIAFTGTASQLPRSLVTLTLAGNYTKIIGNNLWIDLPRSLTSFTHTSSCNFSGDAIDIPRNLSVALSGNLIVNGYIKDLPISTVFALNNTGVIGGNCSGTCLDFPRYTNTLSITNVNWDITGNLADLPKSTATFVFNNVPFLTASGTTSDLPKPTGTLQISDTGASISGDMSNLVSVCAYVNIYNNTSNNISGDIINIPKTSQPSRMYFSGSIIGDLSALRWSPANGFYSLYLDFPNGNCTYTSGTSFITSFPTGVRYITFRIGLSTSSIDALLIDLASKITGTSGLQIDLKGSNQPRSSVSDSAFTYLNTKIKVYTN